MIKNYKNDNSTHYIHIELIYIYNNQINYFIVSTIIIIK